MTFQRLDKTIIVHSYKWLFIRPENFSCAQRAKNVSFSCPLRIKWHTAHVTVSWSNPNQWQMGHTFDLVMIIRHHIRVLKIIGSWVSFIHTAIYIAWKVIAIINFLDTHSTECNTHTMKPHELKSSCNSNRDIQGQLIKAIPSDALLLCMRIPPGNETSNKWGQQVLVFRDKGFQKKGFQIPAATQ